MTSHHNKSNTVSKPYIILSDNIAVDPKVDTTREFVILTTGRISKSRLKEMLRYAQHDIRCWVNTYVIAK